MTICPNCFQPRGEADWHTLWSGGFTCERVVPPDGPVSEALRPAVDPEHHAERYSPDALPADVEIRRDDADR